MNSAQWCLLAIGFSFLSVVVVGLDMFRNHLKIKRRLLEKYITVNSADSTIYTKGDILVIEFRSQDSHEITLLIRKTEWEWLIKGYKRRNLKFNLVRI